MQQARRMLIAIIALSSLELWCGGIGLGQDKQQNREDDRKPIQLPGLVIDFKNHSVDIEATVCLDKGPLELIACRKGAKEHESIISVKARAMHIHTALLLIGAKNGNPAMRKQIGKSEKRWVELEAKGDRISVFLVINKDSKSVERPISDFVIHAKDLEATSKVPNDQKNSPASGISPTTRAFPKHFLFAGSGLADNANGPRQYLADKSGNFISIVTFGDELLCLSEIHSQQNGSLMWRIKPKQLPKVGTKITLRLRPLNNSPLKNSQKLNSEFENANSKEHVDQP